MSRLTPVGYYDFNAALNVVGNHLFRDSWDWREPEASAIPSVDDYVFGNVTTVDAIRRIACPDETAGPSDPELLSGVLDWLWQRLFDERLPSEVLTETSGLISIPYTVWGPKKWDEVVTSGKIEFVSEVTPQGVDSIPPIVSGHVLFRVVEITVLILAFGAASVAAYFAKEAADASRDQAKAAWQQISDARKTDQTALRAYVSVELARVIPIGENGINHIPLAIVNSGQTPAFNLTFDSLSFQATPENFAKQNLWPAPRDRRPLGIGFIPRQTSRTRLFVTNDTINPEAMRTGTHRLYSTGKIFYDDAWGDEHWVKFCIWWGSNGFAPKDATYCSRFNDTDRPEKVQQ